MDDRIRNLVVGYLRDEIHLQDFQQQFAGVYFQARKNRNANRSASKLCDEIVLPLAELSRGHRSEMSFREELVNAIHPFRGSIVWNSIQPDKISLVREKTYSTTIDPWMIGKSSDFGSFLANVGRVI